MKQFLLQQPWYERAIFVCRLIRLSGWSEKLGRTRNAPQRPQRPDVMKRAACKTCQKSHSAPPFAGPTQQRTIFNVRLMRAFRVALPMRVVCPFNQPASAKQSHSWIPWHWQPIDKRGPKPVAAPSAVESAPVKRHPFAQNKTECNSPQPPPTCLYYHISKNSSEPLVPWAQGGTSSRRLLRRTRRPSVPGTKCNPVALTSSE